MILTSIIQKYKYVDGNFYTRVGKSSKVPVNKTQIQVELLQLGMEPLELDNAINVLKQHCKVIENNEESMEDVDFVDICLKSQAFNCFKIVKNLSTGEELVYLKLNNKMRPLGTPGSLTAEEFKVICLDNNCNSYQLLVDTFKQYIGKKKGQLAYNRDEIVKTVFSSVEVHKLFETIEIQTDLHPATVEGCSVESLIKIPYTKYDVTINHLSPKLKEFLTQVQNHRHLCAILWGSLNGIRYPYVVYLFGRGNDGKTGFVNMLAKLFGGSIAKYQDSDKFAMRNMFGKALINVSENTNPHLLQSHTIKNITGGSLLNIEAKGKTGFAGEVRGLIIVDSNISPQLLGEEYETRRLRYFPVKPITISEDDRMTQDNYVKALHSTPNEFLNYCRQCFEELSTPTGMIKPEPNADTTLISLQDVKIALKFETFMKKRLPNYEFGDNLKCDRATILLKVEEAFQKDKFAEMNFDRWLKYVNKVVINGREYIGFGIPKDKIKIENPSDVEEFL